MNKADGTSGQYQEERVSSLSPADRGRFQTDDHRRQAVKELSSRLKAKKMKKSSVSGIKSS